MKGKLIIFSAPSGAGKTTIVKHLLQQDFDLIFSVSATSREPRKGETHGKDYYFIPENEFKKKIENEAADKIHDVDLTYITSRGKWYFISWKGDMSKSGGIATNIGIHFFDMLTWIFGDVEKNVCHLYEGNKAAGFLQLKKARVRWFLSLDDNDLPTHAVEKGMRTYRSITVEGQEIEFSGGFTDLHTKTYQNIIAGKGFGLNDARKSIQITHDIREMKPVGLTGDYHPFLR